MKIFISHASHDKWVARQISLRLNQEGHETFLDEKDIKTGESIDSSIQAHLADSDQLLILLTPASLKSHWVFIELGGAKALGKVVIPILYHVPANEIPQPISSLLCRDINDLENYIEEIGKPEYKTPKKVREILEKKIPKGLIGTRVRVVDVDLLTDDEKEEEPGWVDEMDKYSSREATITGMAGDWYLIDISDEFMWHKNWLIKL